MTQSRCHYAVLTSLTIAAWQAKETLEKEREELRRTKEYEAQLTEYLKQTGITRPEFTKSHTEVQVIVHTPQLFLFNPNLF